MYELARVDAEEAVTHFTVTAADTGGVHRWVHASAGIGRRHYIVSAVPAAWYAHDVDTWQVTVVAPWQATAQVIADSHLSLDFLLARLGDGRPLNDYNAGDLYALLSALRLLLGVTFPEPSDVWP